MPDDVIEEIEAPTDQHGSATPDGFADAMDEALAKSADDTAEVVDEADELDTAEADDTEEVDDTEIDDVDEVDDTIEVVETEVDEVVEPEKPAAAEEPAKETDSVVSTDEIKFDLDPGLVDPAVKEALEKVADRLNTQQKTIDEDRAKLKAEQEKVFENRIDSCFDKFVEDLPDLGNTSKLSKDNGLYRRRLFQHAQVTAKMDGISIEDAIKDTVAMYKNRDGETKAEKKLITKLNKHKTKFTNKPTRKKKNIADRKFKTETEKVNAIMDKAYVDAGIE